MLYRVDADAHTGQREVGRCMEGRRSPLDGNSGTDCGLSTAGWARTVLATGTGRLVRLSGGERNTKCSWCGFGSVGSGCVSRVL